MSNFGRRPAPVAAAMAVVAVLWLASCSSSTAQSDPATTAAGPDDDHDLHVRGALGLEPGPHGVFARGSR